MSSKPQEIVDRFIELRAQGKSFASIGKELGVSKPTLIAWSRKHQHRINNLRELENEALSESFKISRRACLEDLGENMNRLREELARRDLEKVSTERIITLLAMLRSEAVRVCGPLQFCEPVTEESVREETLPIVEVDWKA